MPMKKTTKKTYKRKTPSYGKKRLSWNRGVRGSQVVAAIAPGIGLASSVKTNLRTSFFANVNAGADGIYKTYLKPGSCFDPTGDLSTIQPALFDQYAAIFSRYKVNQFSVKITIIGLNSNSQGWNACAYPSTDNTALTTYQQAASQPWAKTTIGNYASTGASGDPRELSFYRIDHDAIIGATGDTFDTGAVVGSDPPAGQYAVMPMFIQGNTAVVAAYLIHVDMWQNVTFSQRKSVGDA